MNIEAINESQSHSEISPELLLSCSIVYALTLASVIPLLLVITKRLNLTSLMKLNAFNLIMIITIALTWPDFNGGLTKGITIALRVNMIYILFAVMIYPLGYAKIFAALNSLNVPEKLRVLFLLTLRGIFILYDRYSCALISLRLRAKNLHGLMKLRAFAYITCSVLLQSSERSERMLQAVQCRGGFNGFIQSEHKRVRMRDVIACVCFAVYALMIIILNHA